MTKAFYNYIVFLLECTDSNDKKERQKLISANNHLLDVLNTSKKSFFGGSMDEYKRKRAMTNEEIHGLIESLKKRIREHEKQIKNYEDLIKLMDESLEKIIKYIDELYEETEDSDFKVVNTQLVELREKFEKYINIKKEDI